MNITMKNKKILRLITIVSFVVIVFCGAFANTPTASAQEGRTEYTLLEPLPCIPNAQQTCEGGLVKKVSINTYISYIFKFSIALAAFLAVLMIIIGGFQYVTSDIPGAKGDARQRIENAIYGLILIFASYLILYTIDPRLVQVKTTIDPVSKPITSFNPNLDDLTDFGTTVQAQKEVTALNEKIAAARAAAQEFRNQASSDDSLTPEQIETLQLQAQRKDEEANALVKQSVEIRVAGLSDGERKLLQRGLAIGTGNDADTQFTEADRAYYLAARARLEKGYNDAIQDATSIGDAGLASNLNQQKAADLSIAQSYYRASDVLRTAEDPNSGKDFLDGLLSPSSVGWEEARKLALDRAQALYLATAYNKTVPTEITDPALKTKYLADKQKLAEVMLASNPKILPSDSVARQKLIDSYKATHPAAR